MGLLDTVGKHAPKAVEDLVPGVLPLGVVQKVLQLLVRENVSIRDMLTIVETLGDYGNGVKNPDMLAEYVREKLSRSIVRPYLDSQGVLPVLTLNGNAERMVQEGHPPDRERRGLSFPQPGRGPASGAKHQYGRGKCRSIPTASPCSWQAP